VNAAREWALWSVGGRELLASVARSRASVEGADDREWITLEQVSELTIQVAMTPQGPAVAPMCLPLGAAHGDDARLRVRARSIDAVWWFADMAPRVRADFERRARDAARAGTSLAAAGAGIVT
jgi:hypothetical protein